MSEFKFACPVCGQHITADSSSAGGQIDCPTCFQKIVVPQAPSSPDTKFILSAAQVSKPRPTPAEIASQLGPLQPAPRHSSLPALIALLLFGCAAGAAVYVFRDRIFTSGKKPVTVSTNAPSQPPVPVALNTTYPIPTNIQWTLDLANAALPEEPAVGKIHGSGFRCERAMLRGGYLTLCQGKKSPWDLAVNVSLIAQQGEELSGKTVEIPPERHHTRPVTLRWKNEQRKPMTAVFKGGYALKLVFGEAAEGRIPGKIYLSLPDGEQSFVAGTFEAHIRRASPSKRRPPPPPPPPET